MGRREREKMTSSSIGGEGLSSMDFRSVSSIALSLGQCGIKCSVRNELCSRIPSWITILRRGHNPSSQIMTLRPKALAMSRVMDGGCRNGTMEGRMEWMDTTILPFRTNMLSRLLEFTLEHFDPWMRFSSLSRLCTGYKKICELKTPLFQWKL